MLLGARQGELETLRLAGIGGGVGLVGGALATAMSLTVPALAIIPVAAGLLLAAKSIVQGTRMTDETIVLRQIVDAAKELLEYFR